MQAFFSKATFTLALLTLGGVAVAQNIAIVNGKAIPKARFDAFKASLSAQAQQRGQAIPPNLDQQLKDALIEREIFIQDAQARGLDSSDEYKTRLEIARQEALLSLYYETVRKLHTPSEAEIQSRYQAHAKAASGQEYHARHILVESQEQALAILARLKKGARFEDIAKKQSRDTGSATRGGDLDWARPANFVKEFSEAMVALKQGEVTRTPVKSQFGYHIIRLDDVRDAQAPKLEEIRAALTQELAQEKLQKYVSELKGRAKVE